MMKPTLLYLVSVLGACLTQPGDAFRSQFSAGRRPLLSSRRFRPNRPSQAATQSEYSLSTRETALPNKLNSAELEVEEAAAELKFRKETFGSINGEEFNRKLTGAELDAEEAAAELKFREETFDLGQAAVVGLSTGIAVSIFKLSIEAARGIFFEREFLVNYPALLGFIPGIGGLLVGAILLTGSLPPGLRGTVAEVDKEDPERSLGVGARTKSLVSSIRKSAAAVVTLGSGCSLGPEGPCVELGMNVGRSLIDINPLGRSSRWNRQLLACGASAGVAAGFSAPIAGVFFALEVMSNTFQDLGKPRKTRESAKEDTQLSASSTIAPVLIASVLSALASQAILGEHLILKLSNYSLNNPLAELPLYLLLGAASGFVAFAFSQLAKLSQSFFDGKVGSGGFRKTMQSIPRSAKPALGGLFCGLVGVSFPQILFFGYDTLNALLANCALPTSLLLTLLALKTATTAVSAGSGLVGGTFAPSLFLGAMTGASFHNFACFLLNFVARSTGGVFPFELADVAAYAMVGAASVLAALFRAPLTASLLLFELTLDYKVILPLMASAGVGSVVGDILDAKFERVMERRQRRRDQDSVSWGDLSSEKVEAE